MDTGEPFGCKAFSYSPDSQMCDLMSERARVLEQESEGAVLVHAAHLYEKICVTGAVSISRIRDQWRINSDGGGRGGGGLGDTLNPPL